MPRIEPMSLSNELDAGPSAVTVSSTDLFVASSASSGSPSTVQQRPAADESTAMPTLEPSENPAVAQARVLGELSTGYFAFDRARCDASKSGSILEVVNAVRDQRRERILCPGDIPRMLQIEPHLVQIAREPFQPLPKGYATFVATVKRDAIDKAIRGASRGAYELYERAVRFVSHADLLDKLEAAAIAFPALAPRLSPLIAGVRARIKRPGPAYLYYSGCTVSGSPVSRAEDDNASGGRFVNNLLDLWDVTNLDVYKLQLPEVKVEPFEYRGRLDLQREEHSVISARYPLSLNSSPGGFRHDYRVDVYPPRPWPAFERDAVVNPEVKEAVQRHLTGFFEWYASQPGGKRISASTLLDQIKAASPAFTLGGRSPIVAIGKDVTDEAFEGAHPELSYRERLAGPGPAATNVALLHQHGVDGLVATTEDRVLVLPPFTDLYLAPLHWWQVGLIFLLRFLSCHRWPVILWVESAEVIWAFANDALARVKLETDRARFLAAEVHDPSGICDVTKDIVTMTEFVGWALITDLGDGHLAIVLANYHRGAIKYDPEVAQDRWRLQLAADAAHQARMCAYIEHIHAHGYPHDRASIERLHDCGEAAVPDAVRSDLEVLRRRVAEREFVLKSLRAQSAIARGTAAVIDSERAVSLRHMSYQRHEKARGRKSDQRRRDPDDPVRVAQFERLLAEQRAIDNRRLPNSRHPCRPEGMSVEEWRAWLLRLDEGIEIQNSAAQHGKVPIDPATQLKGLKAIKA